MLPPSVGLARPAPIFALFASLSTPPRGADRAHWYPWGCSTGSVAARRCGVLRATPPAPAPPPSAASDRATSSTCSTSSQGRRGVEGFVEPRTAVSDVTLLLVAHDGEWTRRRVPSVQWAHQFANKHQVPSYDAAVVGVPQRMREYNRRKKAGES